MEITSSYVYKEKKELCYEEEENKQCEHFERLGDKMSKPHSYEQHKLEAMPSEERIIYTMEEIENRMLKKIEDKLDIILRVVRHTNNTLFD